MSKSKKLTLFILIPLFLQLILAGISRMIVSPNQASYSGSVNVLFATIGTFFAVYLFLRGNTKKYTKLCFIISALAFLVLGVLSATIGVTRLNRIAMMDYFVALHPLITFGLICLCAQKGLKGVVACVIYSLLICLDPSALTYGALFCCLSVVLIIMCLSVNNSIFDNENKSIFYVVIILPIAYALASRLYVGPWPEVIFTGEANGGIVHLDIIRDVLDNIAVFGKGGPISSTAYQFLAGYPLLFWAYSLGWISLIPIGALVIIPWIAFYQMIKLVSSYEGRMLSLTVGLVFVVRILGEIPVSLGFYYVSCDMAFPFLEPGPGSIVYAFILALWFAMLASDTPEQLAPVNMEQKKEKKLPKPRKADKKEKEAADDILKAALENMMNKAEDKNKAQKMDQSSQGSKIAEPEKTESNLPPMDIEKEIKEEKKEDISEELPESKGKISQPLIREPLVFGKEEDNPEGGKPSKSAADLFSMDLFIELPKGTQSKETPGEAEKNAPKKVFPAQIFEFEEEAPSEPLPEEEFDLINPNIEESPAKEPPEEFEFVEIPEVNPQESEEVLLLETQIEGEDILEDEIQTKAPMRIMKVETKDDVFIDMKNPSDEE